VKERNKKSKDEKEKGIKKTKLQRKRKEE